MDKDDRYTRITLRIPKDLHSKLSDAADVTSKSMNAEIIARLEESFRSAPPETASSTFEEILQALDESRQHMNALMIKLRDAEIHERNRQMHQLPDKT